MTIDDVFTLFKKPDFNTILACLGGNVYQWWRGGHNSFAAWNGGRGRSFIDVNFWKIWDPLKKMTAPCNCQ